MRIRLLHPSTPRKAASRRPWLHRSWTHPAGILVVLAIILWAAFTGQEAWRHLHQPLLVAHSENIAVPPTLDDSNGATAPLKIGSEPPWAVGHHPQLQWTRPDVRGSPILSATTHWDVTTNAGRVARRECAQRHLFAEHGLDTLKEYFMQGCNVPPMRDFDRWAAQTGCGSEPIEGPLLIHTAWMGPYDHVREDLDALIDSFLMTQDLSQSKLFFWFLDGPVNKSSSFVQKYQGRHDAVEFREVKLAEFAKGTTMEGRVDILEMNWSTVKKGPRWKANMFRVLALHKYGGVWVDTDSVLLRDLRPMFEFAGEFASKLTMSLYYNNNVLGLRKGSPISTAMVDDIVATPLESNSKRYCRYVGSPCYPKWTWNHGLIQLAVRRRVGIVIFPTTYTDPAYGCFPQWLLGKSGGDPMRTFSIYEVLEFIRGAFVLHSRAYKAIKPIHPRSNYGRLYQLAAEGAKAAGIKSAPLVGIAPRSQSGEAELTVLFERRGERDNVVDPPFVPRTPWRPVLLKSARLGSCVNAVRHVKGEMYGGNPELIVTADCPAATRKFNETVVFLWHADGGYLRPAHREPGRVLCADALVLSAQSIPAISWSTAPKMITCNPDRPTQQWSFDADGRLANPHTGLCIEAVGVGGPGNAAQRLVMRACSSSVGGQRFQMIPFTAADMPY